MPEIIEGLEAAKNPNRLYPIVTNRHCGFYAGRTADGRQLLAGERCPDLLVGFFDNGGNLREVHYQRIEEQGEVEQRLHEWYGYLPELIRVKRFRIAPSPDQPTNPLQLALPVEP
jgi:hypothetical protein